MNSGTQAMVVNEQFIRTYLTDGAPIVGRRYNNMLKPDEVTEIVGVVSDVLKGGFTDVPQAEFYVLLGNQGAVTTGREINLVIRSSGDTALLATTLRTVVREIDPNGPVYGVTALGDEVSASADESRFAATVLAAFALLASGLAALGLHGGLMYALSRRKRELGVRSVLGASRRGLIALVLREAVAVTTVGVLLGLVVASAGTRTLGGFLFGVDPLDTFSFLVGPVILVLGSLAACVIPAWRVSTLEPTQVLRDE